MHGATVKKNTKELNKTKNSQSEQITKSNPGIQFCRIYVFKKGEVNVGIKLNYK